MYPVSSPQYKTTGSISIALEILICFPEVLLQLHHGSSSPCANPTSLTSFQVLLPREAILSKSTSYNSLHNLLSFYPLHLFLFHPPFPCSSPLASWPFLGETWNTPTLDQLLSLLPLPEMQIYPFLMTWFNMSILPPLPHYHILSSTWLDYFFYIAFNTILYQYISFYLMSVFSN